MGVSLDQSLRWDIVGPQKRKLPYPPMCFTVRTQERQAKMVSRFIEGHSDSLEKVNYCVRGRMEGMGRIEVLRPADQGVTGSWEGVWDQDFRSPNTWPLSPRAMHGAELLPAVKSLPLLFIPNSSRRESVSSLDPQVCVGWE